jgi:hypothetical protein
MKAEIPAGAFANRGAAPSSTQALTLRAKIKSEGKRRNTRKKHRRNPEKVFNLPPFTFQKIKGSPIKRPLSRGKTYPLQEKDIFLIP